MAWWVFQNIVVTTALALVVAAVCRISRIGPVARHALWVLVLVKFVTPPLVVWPWAAPDPLGVSMAGRDVDARSIADAPPPRPERPAGNLPSRAGNFAPGDFRARSMSQTAVLWPWLAGVWAAGSLCVVGIESMRLARLARRVRAAEPADAAIVSRVATLAAHLRVRPVRVVTVSDGASPLVWCLGRPLLLWPADLPATATDTCIDGLLVHELAHVKRRDHLVGWIELAAGVVWWWNPLFWYVRSARREQAELACDAWVISALPHGRRAYAESLLALSGAAVRGAPPMGVVAVRAGSRRLLERRLVMIMQGRAPLRLSLAGVVALALLAAATLPAWATGQPPPPQPAQAVQSPPPPPPAARPKAQKKAIAFPSPKTIQVKPVGQKFKVEVATELPADGRKLLQAFEADRAAIQAEADQKVALRREALVKSLQALQDQYAKEGKLDEAVAIRDYLKAGLPRVIRVVPKGDLGFGVTIR